MSAEAEAAVGSEERCAHFKESLENGNKDWFKNKPNPDDKDQRVTYTYMGEGKSVWDKYGIFSFYPDDCSFSSLNKGELNTFTFR